MHVSSCNVDDEVYFPSERSSICLWGDEILVDQMLNKNATTSCYDIAEIHGSHSLYGSLIHCGYERWLLLFVNQNVIILLLLCFFIIIIILLCILSLFYFCCCYTTTTTILILLITKLWWKNKGKGFYRFARGRTFQKFFFFHNRIHSSCLIIIITTISGIWLQKMRERFFHFPREFCDQVSLFPLFSCSFFTFLGIPLLLYHQSGRALHDFFFFSQIDEVYVN